MKAQDPQGGRIINNGSIVADDVPENLKHAKRESIVISIEFKEEVDPELLRPIEGVLDVKRKEKLILVEAAKEVDVRPAVFNFATEKGYTLLGMNQESVTMEDIFRKLTSE